MGIGMDIGIGIGIDIDLGIDSGAWRAGVACDARALPDAVTSS